MRILTRSTALLATCALLLLGGCSSDDDGGGVEAADTTSAPGDESTTTGGDAEGGGGGDAQAFCDFIVESEDLDIDEDPEAVAAAMVEMRSLAPEEIRSDVEALLEFVEQMAGIDEDDPEAFGEIMALALDPEFVALGERLDAFGVEECGMEPGDFMGGSDDEEFTPITSGEGDAPDDDFEFDEPENGLSIDVLQSFVEETYGDEPWASELSSWTIMGGTDVQVGPFDEDLTIDEAKAACEALAVKVFELEPDATLEIMDTANEAVVRWSPTSETCTAIL